MQPSGGTFWLAPRLLASLPSTVARHTLVVSSILTGSASLVVSYKFFQESVYRVFRTLAFEFAPPALDSTLATDPNFVMSIQKIVSQVAFTVSDMVHGAPILGNVPWLRLLLPNLIGIAPVLLVTAFSLVPSKSTGSRLQN
jgi:hypothetical protein